MSCAARERNVPLASTAAGTGAYERWLTALIAASASACAVAGIAPRAAAGSAPGDDARGPYARTIDRASRAPVPMAVAKKSPAAVRNAAPPVCAARTRAAADDANASTGADGQFGRVAGTGKLLRSTGEDDDETAAGAAAAADGAGVGVGAGADATPPPPAACIAAAYSKAAS
jgi:hypothetical protein